MKMNNFSNIDKSSGISNTPGGVWKIEKKRKTRDKKNKQQNISGNKQNSKEDDDSVLVDIELDIEADRENKKECEDQTDYGFIKKKKSKHTRVDLKI
jgi:hypothetical protein